MARVLVTGAGEFVGAHLDAQLARVGHRRVRSLEAGADAIVHLGPNHLRGFLDRASNAGVRRFVLLSTLGADSAAASPVLAERGRAEEQVRAGGIPWVIVRPEILWGPGDVFTNELAHLLRHLPFLPLPRKSPAMAPVYVGDVARALAEAVDHDELVGHAWSLVGPEVLHYDGVVERVAEAIDRAARRRLRVPAWSVRLGAALEERLAHRPKMSRQLLDHLVAGEASGVTLGERLDLPLRAMEVGSLRAYLARAGAPASQVASSA